MPSAKNLSDGTSVDLDETAFGARFNGPLVHESVRAELAAKRQGTSSTKTRGEVRGGGAKPWRQKAFRSALSIHADRGSLAVFDPKAFDDVSTKAAAKLVSDWGAKGSLLIVLGSAEERVALSFRNLADVRAVIPTTNVGVADLVGAANVLVSPTALDELTARAKGDKKEEASA
jgi:large subunit ribosomal protein L4